MKHISACLTLPNGREVSIQHSLSHYCGEHTAEVAVIYKGEFLDGFPHCNSGGVASYVTTPQLTEIINWAAAR